jgi:hypothetical protein
LTAGYWKAECSRPRVVGRAPARQGARCDAACGMRPTTHTTWLQPATGKPTHTTYNMRRTTCSTQHPVHMVQHWPSGQQAGVHAMHASAQSQAQQRQHRLAARAGRELSEISHHTATSHRRLRYRMDGWCHHREQKVPRGGTDRHSRALSGTSVAGCMVKPSYRWQCCGPP